MSIWNYANPQLKDLVAYEPGKPIEDVARERGLEAGGHHQAGLEREPARPLAEGHRGDAKGRQKR
jgi:histidinol-phosphate aminotransferase